MIFPNENHSAILGTILTEFNFTNAHIPGKNNTAADNLSRLEISPKEKIILRIREDIQTTTIELLVQSAGVAEEEQLYYTKDDDETEEDIWQRKKQARDNPTHQLSDIPFRTFSIHHSAVQGLSICQKLANINTVPIEQNNDVILQQLKLKIQKKEYSETILLQDTRYQHYIRQLDRMSIQNEIITRQYYECANETGNVKYNQILLPKHLVNKLLDSLQGKANRHPGIAKMLQEIRCKYYYPGIAKLVRKWVNGC